MSDIVKIRFEVLRKACDWEGQPLYGKSTCWHEDYKEVYYCTPQTCPLLEEEDEEKAD